MHDLNGCLSTLFYFRLVLFYDYDGHRVMENFQLIDGHKFCTLVEVAAQNALFHVIVDTVGITTSASPIEDVLEKVYPWSVPCTTSVDNYRNT